MASLKKFKLFSLLVLFFFSLQILGLPNLAHAVAAASAAALPDDPLITCSAKARSIINNLKNIQDGIRRGEDQTIRLAAVSSEMQEVLGFRSAVEAKLNEDGAKLLSNPQIPPQIRDRHLDFANKTIAGFADLERIAATLNELIARGNIRAEELESIAGAMEKLAPQPAPAITGQSHKLPHCRAEIEKKHLKHRPAIHSGVTSPGPQDLAPTIDVQMSQEIITLANQLHNDPLEIFRYVKNKIDYQPYFGSVKGALGTFWEKAGNDVDQASFLIALFRASNIPARYISGEVKLNIQKVMNWTGTECPEAAVQLMEDQGIPVEAITGKGGAITHLKFFHTWVAAYVSSDNHDNHGKKCAKISRWTQMDPSFKKYEYRQGLDLKQAMGFDFESFYNAAVSGATINQEQSFVTNLNEANITANLNNYANNLMNWVNANMPGATVGDVLGSRKIKEKHLEHLHHRQYAFPFETSAPQMEMSELPSTWRHLFNFQMNGFSYYASMPELYGKRLSLAYVPATAADQQLIEAYGGIFNVPPYLVNMQPQLKLEGQVVAAGLAVMLGSFQNCRSQFLRPWETSWITFDRPLTTGADYSVFLNHQRISLDLLKKRAQNFGALIANLQGGEVTQEVVEEALHLTGMVFFAETEMHNDIAGKISRVTWTREPALAFLTRDITVWVTWTGIPALIKRASVGLDVKRSALRYTSVTNNAQDEFNWKSVTGCMLSATEHAVFEQLYGIEAISTMKILALANKNGIPIYTIDRNNIDQILPYVSAPGIVAQDIVNNVVNNGWIAVIPQQGIQLNQWTGYGYIVMDPQTGNAGYYITGHVISGNAKEITAGGGGTNSGDFEKGVQQWGNNTFWEGVWALIDVGAGILLWYAARYIVQVSITGAIIVGGVGLGMVIIGIILIGMWIIYSGSNNVIRRRLYASSLQHPNILI